MTVILDEMDAVFVEGRARYRVQQTVQNRDIQGTLSSSSLKMQSQRPSTRWHAYISKKPHEVTASHPSMQCATSLINQMQLTQQAHHIIFSPSISIFLGQHRGENAS
jgi:hypothetical protein